MQEFCARVRQSERKWLHAQATETYSFFWLTSRKCSRGEKYRKQQYHYEKDGVYQWATAFFDTTRRKVGVSQQTIGYAHETKYKQQASHGRIATKADGSEDEYPAKTSDLKPHVKGSKPVSYTHLTLPTKA